MSFETRIEKLIHQVDDSLSMSQIDEKENMSSSTNGKVYKWGIIGCGLISSDFANALDKHPRCKIVACAARKLSSAKEFATKFDIETYYDNYDSLACDESIDIVYIGTIHPTHCSNALACLNNKKHVICEKPIGMNSNEVKKMMQCAQENNVFLLEAMWTRFFPVIKKIRHLIFKEEAIGDIVSFMGDFGLNMPSKEKAPRLWKKEMGGGAVLDLGCYVCAPLTLVFGAKIPKTIAAVGTVVDGIDSMMSAVMKYEEKQFASISCNFYGVTPEEHHIIGTKGRIVMDHPGHCPNSFTLIKYGNCDEKNDQFGANIGSSASARDIVSKKTETFKNPTGFRYKTNFVGSEGLYYEVQECVDCLDKGLLESPFFTHKEMLVTNQIMDELRKQIGVKYEQDG